MIRRLVVLVAGCALVAACPQSKGLEVVEAAPEPPTTVVVLGGAEGEGAQVRDDLRDLWARRVFDELPISTTYVNLASPGASIADVQATQVPPALELEPDTVLMWSMATDDSRGTSDPGYAEDLLGLVGSFPDGTEVVVLDGPGSTYSEAVAEVVASSGATSVDVTDVGSVDGRDQDEIARRVAATLQELDGGG